MKIPICEIFGPVVQGEGKRMGRSCIFIRASGCNLRCMWENKDGSFTKCDTPYSSWDIEIPNRMEPEEILKKVNAIRRKNKKENNVKIKDVIITGGEPFIQKSLKRLVELLKSESYYITIETNGTLFQNIPWIDLVSISPKLKSSIPNKTQFEKENKLHLLGLNNYKNSIKQFNKNYINKQFKFVVNTEEDINEIHYFIERYGLKKEDVWLMPQGDKFDLLIKNHKKVMDLALKHGFHFSSRLHIISYSDKRGV